MLENWLWLQRSHQKANKAEITINRKLSTSPSQQSKPKLQQSNTDKVALENVNSTPFKPISLSSSPFHTHLRACVER
jgi:hypothetical protein